MTMLRRTTFVLTLAALTTAAAAHNGARIYLTTENGKLLTSLDTFIGAHNITPGISVFPAAFGNDPENPTPNFTQFPGLSGSVTSPTALPVGSSVSFSIDGPVKYWNGTGSVSFGSSTETISISSGLNVVTSSNAAVPGFTLVAAVPGTDGWHTHPAYTLNPDNGGQFQSGVYLLPLTFSNNGLTSAPVWIVFGQNVSQETVAAAVAAVPEPASLGVLACFFVLCSKRVKSARRSI